MLLMLVIIFPSIHGQETDYKTCTSVEYQCFDGSCIDMDHFCDFYPDCADRSDEINCYLECVPDTDTEGYKYTGKRNVSRSGRPCQRYDQQFPHVHKYGYLGETTENYCRNHYDSSYPWCYTVDPEVRWEQCNVPRCRQLEETRCSFDSDMCDWKSSRDSTKTWTRQSNYIGSTLGDIVVALEVSKQRRDEQPLLFTPVILPSARPLCFTMFFSMYGMRYSTLEINVTRGSGFSELLISEGNAKPLQWKEVRLSILESVRYGITIKVTADEDSSGGVIAVDNLSFQQGACLGLHECSEEEYKCKDHSCIDVNYFCDEYPDCPDHTDEFDCQLDCLPEYDPNGLYYHGLIDFTKSGQGCRSWDDPAISNLTTHDVDSENYCRNKDGSSKPWCYTTNSPLQREDCTIPSCDFDCLQTSDLKGQNYFGYLNLTASGLQCQRWDQQSPHTHDYETLAEHENYCRNAYDDDGLWCFTMDPEVRWDWCHLPTCVPRACEDGGSKCPGEFVNQQLIDDIQNTNHTSSPQPEANDNVTCTNRFQCRGSSVCLRDHQICDGIPQCPYHEDELFCNSTCTQGCVCYGFTVRCLYDKQENSIVRASTRSLSINGKAFNMTKFFENKLPVLVFLNICNTHISSISEANIFAVNLQSTRLRILRLSHNRIMTIYRFAFAGLRHLRALYLTGNPISDLAPDMFSQLHNLIYLSIADSSLRVVQTDTFKGLSNLEMLNLSHGFIEYMEPKALHHLSSVSNIDLSHNRLISVDRYFAVEMSNLAFLDLSHNRIENLTLASLDGLLYVQSLNLSKNRMKVIRSNSFYTLFILTTLNLSFNAINYFEIDAFAGQASLQILDLQGNSLDVILPHFFSGLAGLEYMNLNDNNLLAIEDNAFSTLDVLESLKLQNNKLSVQKDMFHGLCKLKTIYADSYTICCAKPPTVEPENCVAPSDKISSCDKLIDVGLLSISIWFIALFTITGNACVIIYRTFVSKEHYTIPHVTLVINLSVSDFLMGVYLFIIATTDLTYRGEYGYYDHRWRNSEVCMFSGVLATLSSEASAMFLLIITIDRVIAIKFPFSPLRFTKTASFVASMIIWMIAVCLSIAPLMFASFHSNSSVCLSLPLSRERKPGWEYSVGLFIIFNLVLFIGIVIGQLLIYFEVRNVGKRVCKTKSNEVALAKTLVSLALTDALCWIPIAVLGLVTLGGIEVSSSIYAWVVVLVLPINSALNPFLYTVSAIRAKQARNNSKQVLNAKAPKAVGPAKSPNNMDQHLF